MNPHATQSASLPQMCRSIWGHRGLILQMTVREVAGRYRGSFFGLAWSLFNPILMLSVYTFVFSVVFKSRWGTNPAGENKSEFAVILFVGLIVYGFFAEVINRAPALIVSNVNYVKKVVFPLEILPVVTMAAALFHSLVSTFVLLVAFVLLNGFLHWTVILIPLVVLPLIILVVGLAWLLASLGVFLRDLAQTISIITMVFMFLSPIFYPVTALPERFRTWFMINPLTFVIEETRAVAIFGQMPNWTGLALYFVGSCLVAWFGYAWFQKTRKGFADVI
ncbi:ABC transporter permease [Bordetella genomosp. 11]|uniref:Transport permease protein n=1 Tax=Bordetella genomosp. 11 TaxID=1416808 RepID=A0A261UM69_9BORD|nr:ABC transporter permease [Bordetella genomosp. 11]OZI62979.1 sugar ABC transporter permease [Bordetella genomosp. 11]